MRDKHIWRDNPTEVRIINGKPYDYLSASHNGLVGAGLKLKMIIKEANNGKERGT